MRATSGGGTAAHCTICYYFRIQGKCKPFLARRRSGRLSAPPRPGSRSAKPPEPADLGRQRRFLIFIN
jgi:hypothetical protein